jgi:hypothetical protein
VQQPVRLFRGLRLSDDAMVRMRENRRRQRERMGVSYRRMENGKSLIPSGSYSEWRMVAGLALDSRARSTCHEQPASTASVRKRGTALDMCISVRLRSQCLGSERP